MASKRGSYRPQIKHSDEVEYSFFEQLESYPNRRFNQLDRQDLYGETGTRLRVSQKNRFNYLKGLKKEDHSTYWKLYANASKLIHSESSPSKEVDETMSTRRSWGPPVPPAASSPPASISSTNSRRLSRSSPAASIRHDDCMFDSLEEAKAFINGK